MAALHSNKLLTSSTVEGEPFVRFPGQTTICICSTGKIVYASIDVNTKAIAGWSGLVCDR